MKKTILTVAAFLMIASLDTVNAQEPKKEAKKHKEDAPEKAAPQKEEAPKEKAPEKEKSRRKSTGLYFEWIKIISELQVNFQPLSELSYRYTNT
jgi:hypothetical protein